jgi:CubicO group peptidase (beta-lactamase class C family)
MKRGLLAIGALVVLAPLLLAQRPDTDSRLPLGRPEDVGLSTARLTRLTTAMQGYINRKEAAGVVTLVARQGRVVHFESLGQRSVEDAAPMGTDTMFRLASMTKPIVAVAAMMLYEEGAFQLSDPVSKWLPEFRNMQVIEPQATVGTYRVRPASNPITIRHVLTQTSGLQNGDGALAAAFTKIAARSVPKDTLGAFVSRLATLPLNFEPGTRWHYGPNGTSTNVVGRLVEVISRQSLDQFLSERIFKPLQLTDTYYYVPENKLSRFAALYKPGANQTIEIDEAPTAASLNVREGTYFGGSGGLVSTAADYFRFQQMMLNGGELNGVRLLGRKTVELITANQTGSLYTAEAPGLGFGLSVSVVTDVGASAQHGSVGTYGWGGAAGTLYFVDPVEQLIGIFMVQLRPYAHLNIRRDFRTLVYQALVGPDSRVISSN